MPFKARTRRAHKRGIVLVLAIFFLALLELISLGLARMVPVELFSSGKNRTDTQAHYAAVAGIMEAKQWITYVVTPTGNSGASVNPASNFQDLGDSSNWFNGSFSTQNDPASVPNGNNEYQLMQLSAVSLPGGTTKYAPPSGTYLTGAAGLGLSSAQIPSGASAIVTKNPLQIPGPDGKGDWEVWTAIVPDGYTPGGGNAVVVGGGSLSGRRCYEIISVAFLYGVPKLRARSTVLEESFAKSLYFVNKDPDVVNGEQNYTSINTANTTVFNGPVHTNGYFRIDVTDPNIWNQTTPSYTGVMTYASTPPAGRLTPNVDQVEWVMGNWNGNNQGNAPWDQTNHLPIIDGTGESRYQRLIQGGQANLRQVNSIPLPQNTNEIATAAFGSSFTSGTPPTSGASQGIYIAQGSGQASGGMYINGNVSQMIMEAVDNNGNPILDVTALEAGSGAAANANPAIRVQMSQASAITSTQVTTNPTTSNQAVPTGTTTNFGSGVTTNLATNAVTVSTTGTTKTTNFSTVTATNPILQTNAVGTSTGSVQVPVTSFTTATSVSLVSGPQGQGGTFVTNFVTSVAGITTNTQHPLTTSFATITAGTTAVAGQGPAISTVTATNNGLQTNHVTSTLGFTTGTTTSFSTQHTTNIITSTVTATGMTTQTWRPIDRVIQTKYQAMSIPSAVTWADTGTTQSWSRPAGASDITNTALQMSGITATQVIVNGATLAAGASYPVPVGDAVLISQSRTNPNVLIVQDIKGQPPAQGSTVPQVLDGSVVVAGSIMGLNGVNKDRQTIAVNVSDQANVNSKSDGQINIIDHVWQYGTQPGQTPSTANNSLGIVADMVNLPTDIKSFDANSGSGKGILANSGLYASTASPQSLFVYAAILAGTADKITYTVNGTQTNSTSYGANGGVEGNNGNLAGYPAGKNPYFSFFGSLIEASRTMRGASSSGGSVFGWKDNLNYDQQLANDPPPFFPSTGGFSPVSYQEERL